MSTADLQIRILSFNCWGLKYVSKFRAERLRGIADQLASSDYDVIGLQELWVNADYELIRLKLSKRLPYAKYFYSGALGSGLAIFSKYPFLKTNVYPYALNGSPLDVAGGDWFVGKAVASAVISHPILNEVEVFNTHMYARGGEDGPESQRAHRLAGAWEIVKHVMVSSALGRYVVLMGDLNSNPSSLIISLIRDHGRMTDSWASSHDAAVLPPAAAVHNAQHAIRDFGVTADSPLNTFSAGKQLDAHAQRWQGKRLDYIFFRDPAPPYEQRAGRFVRAPSTFLVCKESSVVMTGNVPGYNFSFSDHFGLAATLEIHETETSMAPSVESITESYSPVPDSRTHSRLQMHDETGNGEEESHALRQYPQPIAINSAPSEPSGADLALTTTLQALATAYRESRVRSRRYLYIFAASVLTAVALIIGSAWVSIPWVNSIITLLAVFFGWLGTTMLYVGFVFGRWEVNAMTMIIEELEMYRNSRSAGVRSSALLR
ncbi:hypothetical protein BOTBODRAFT_54609 [Botryobasidium botryosum FD-172 SS1]|uniref:Endonuclease/exonuclease/phosphatase domain-containing protein n=1 Tax=Botryobasidium botryosum (strain FD-172 SS1) TaxID=930990 RepID=A0A067MJL1_BOTB1|nr:hypothetical protein BOTBODRAFT_54609 [Botryobasidium botryosum FD-172 SS1]